MKTRQYISRHIFNLLALASIFFLFGCEHEDFSVLQPNENIRPAGDFIKNNYDFKLFYAALAYTGLIEELNGEGPFTVLAVGDKAFNEIGIHRPSDFTRLDRDSLRRALQYHVLVNRRLMVADLPTNGVDVRYETWSGDQLYASIISFSPGGTTPINDLYFNGSKVLRKDVILANGVLQVIDKVMKYHKGKTVKDFLQSLPQYSVYVAGLKKFGLWDELGQEGPFTIFAPNNDAFAAQGIDLDTINDINTSLYEGNRLFGAYIMYGKHYFISDREVFAAINNEFNFNIKLRNDEYWLAFQTTTEWPDWLLKYSITLSKPNPNNPWGDIVGTANSTTRSRFDHLCENGLVHDLEGVVILPEQAMKTQSTQ